MPVSTPHVLKFIKPNNKDFDEQDALDKCGEWSNSNNNKDGIMAGRPLINKLKREERSRSDFFTLAHV